MSQIVRLKISLDRIRPPVWRRIEVPIDMTLEELHLVIQAAMGWDNSHLYAFRTPMGSWSDTDPDYGMPNAHSAETTTLAELRRRGGGRKFTYIYDFGDDWWHTVQVEAVIASEPNTLYPRLLKAKGACPPEDIGGPWGYFDFLEAIGDPQHERHHELLEWHGPDFDPAVVDEARIRKHLEELARARSPRKAGSRAA